MSKFNIGSLELKIYWIDTAGLYLVEEVSLLVDLNDGVGNDTPGLKARGSLNCANVTMETFVQTFQSDLKKIKVSA